MGNCFSSEDSPTPPRHQHQRTSQRRIIEPTSPEPLQRPISSILQTLQQSNININNNNNNNQATSRPLITLINNLEYCKNDMISSNVYEGSLSGRKVAVKIGDRNKIEREVRLQINLEHPNILHYFLRGEVDNKTYLISDFYKISLNDHRKLKVPAKCVMRQLTLAVDYMQNKKIVHLDIAPDNVFIIMHDSDFTVKLTSFEYAQQMTTESLKVTSYNLNNALKGFTPPEVRNTSIAYKFSDVWSLARVLAYLKGVVNGQKRNVRGKNDKRRAANNVEDPYQININQSIKNDSNENVMCKDLLSVTLDEKKRISPKEILKHPFFWSTQETLNFILEVTIMLENGNDFRSEIYKGYQRVIGGKDADWTKRIGKNLLQEIQKSRQQYRDRIGANNEDVELKKITSLITTIRNLMVHAKSAETLAIVGNTDESFLKFWTTRFPFLILHLHDAKRRYENKEN